MRQAFQFGGLDFGARPAYERSTGPRDARRPAGRSAGRPAGRPGGARVVRGKKNAGGSGGRQPPG